MRRIPLILLLLCATQGWSRDSDSTEWRVVFDTRSLGPIETVMSIHKDEGTWKARTRGRDPIAIDLARALRAFHLQNEIGSIEQGKHTDMLILRANPLESISAYQQIDRVILGGQVIDRNSLSAKQP